MSTILGADTKVNEFLVTVFLSTDVAQQKIQGSILSSLRSRGDVLYMCHILSLKDDNARNYPCIRIPNHKKSNILGETTHQQSHFVRRVHRTGIVICRKHIFQHLPVFPQTCLITLSHSLYIEAAFQCFLGLAYSQGAHNQRIGNAQDSSNSTALKLCPRTE